jgi:hypothetical protein
MLTALALVYKKHTVVAAWLLLNILDTVLTMIALRMGATELGPMYQISGSMAVSTAIKYLSVFLFVDILVQIKRIEWLNWFAAGILLVVSWNLAQILTNF